MAGSGLRWKLADETGGQGALFADEELVERHVGTGEYRGLEFLHVDARRIVNEVPASSPVPFRYTINAYRGCSHACVYCLAGDTPVLMADGRAKPIRNLRVGDRVYGTVRRGAYRRYVATEVLAHWSTSKPAVRITLADGTTLVASGDHRFLSDRGWKHVRRLDTGDKLVGTGAFAEGPKHDEQYRLGYLWGMRRLTEWPDEPDEQWEKGFLAGIFDAEGSCSGSALRISNGDPEILQRSRSMLEKLGFDAAIEPPRPDGVTNVRIRGGLRERLRFFLLTDPAITRKRTIDGMAIKSTARLGVVSVEQLGIELPMFDITTGTGDFIANGVVSHNCFARPTHEYLGLGIGEDFDRKLVVKVNAVERLRAELRSPKWGGDHIAMGTNTDPYQRAEGKYHLTRGIVRVLGEAGNPFSILTKSTLVLRDLDVLMAAAERTEVRANFSIGTLDEAVWKATEPGTPHPRRRVEAVRRLNAAGIPCGVLVAPILPGLSDRREQLSEVVHACVAAGAVAITPIALHLRPGVREHYMEWLRRAHPELVDDYERRYRRSYLPSKAQDALAETVRELVQEAGGIASPPNRSRGRSVARPRPPVVETPPSTQLTLLSS